MITTVNVDSVQAIAVPTPWPVGPVNVYLIEDDPLTLVDTGPAYPPAIAALEAALAAGGRRVEDLERIVVTHQHIDHWGLAAHLAERSGAEVCALEGLDRWLADYPASLVAEDGFADDLLREHGGGAAVGRLHRQDRDYADGVTVDRTLRHGDVLEFAHRRLRVLHRPGHSRSDTVLHDEQRRILLGADHVLSKRSVAILSPPLDNRAAPERGRPRALAQYMTSLRTTAAMDLQVVLPGHGAPLRDHRAVIADRLGGYARARAGVAAAIGDVPRTAVEVAESLRGPIRRDAMFFALCDVLGHLDALLDDGAIEETRDADGLTRFTRTTRG